MPIPKTADTPISAAAPLRIGARASPLARWQADWVGEQLRRLGHKIEFVPIVTRGDQQPGPIEEIGGGQGVFTKELQRALLEGRIDLAVHSLKDLPTEVVPGLSLAAVPSREVNGDALVSRAGLLFENLPQGAKIGTGSQRRRAQLLHVRPDLRMEAVRGNVDTRLRKVREGQYDALVLAHAGLKRLGLEQEITQVLPKSLLLPAVGQGALGLETRSDDVAARQAVVPLNDISTEQAVLAERALLFTLRGGCLAPVGAWGRIETDGRLHLSAVVLNRDGRRCVTASGSSSATEGEALGRRVAAALIQEGATELIADARSS